MYMDFSVSPDGRYILRETVNEPFSYLVTFNSFGRQLEVMDLDGKVLSEVRRTPLQEAQARSVERGDDDLPREVEWRPDGKGLSFLRKEEKPKEESLETRPRRDRLMLLTPPFDMTRAQTLATSEHAMSSVSYARDGRYAFLTLAKRAQAQTFGTREGAVVMAVQQTVCIVPVALCEIPALLGFVQYFMGASVLVLAALAALALGGELYFMPRRAQWDAWTAEALGPQAWMPPPPL
jgi:hypothetical protein